jgi:predicted TPR repeat methyltransferase
MSTYFGGSSGHLLADKRYMMALQLAEGGDHKASADLLHQGIELAPGWPPFHFHLGEALRQSGNTEQAAKTFHDYLALDPEDTMGASIKLSLLGTAPPPPVLPVGYVRSLFDQYAPKFEKCLVENLSYKTPRHIAEAVRSINPGPYNRILDLGCGTGLAGAEFMADAKHMTGIDIAPRMIEQSRAKNIYHALHVATVEDFLQEDTTPPYDLVLSADVFVYIGALENIFKQISARLAPGGLFAMSVQTLSSGDWSLGEDHRYAHSKNYLERCTTLAGLTPTACESVTLRKDAGKPVQGMMFIARLG